MQLFNNWVGYVDRSFEQIKTKILNELASQTPITDMNETNPWVKLISIWAGIAEMLGYYVDNRSREAFLPTARKFESGVKIARFADYRVRGPLAASVDLTFTSNVLVPSDVLIPEGTEVKTSNNVTFFTVQDATILTGTDSIQVAARQWTPVNNVNLGTSDGSEDQTFDLEENVVDNNITVLVNAQSFLPVDSFALQTPTDKVFKNAVNEQSVMQIIFGDNIAGEIPQAGQDVITSYFITQGSSGNVGATLINEIVSTITTPVGVELTVNNILAASGGSDGDTLDDLKKLIPRKTRTRERAVTELDYIDLATLVSGVSKGGVRFDCARDIEIFVTPQGGGVASQALLDDVIDFFEERKIIGRNLTANSAGEISLKISAKITALPNFQNSIVENSIKTNLIDFLSPNNQNINGSVLINDVIQVIESTEGVNFSENVRMTPVPFARPIEGTTNVLDWQRNILSTNNDTTKYVIKFVTTTTFEVVRADTFIGTFAVDNIIDLSDVSFEITGSYSIGDKYEFFVYQFTGTLRLNEPSIPVTDVSNITLAVIGGIN